MGRAKAYDRAYAYDQNGRLTTVTDTTASATGTTQSPDTPPTAAAPCVVRAYAFDTNGRRTSLTSTNHTDGNCTSTGYTPTTTSYAYDNADRPTTGGNSAGTYTYDPFGRQTTIPGADAPDPTKGDITLAYYDDDLIRAITQGASTPTTTTFTLDSAGRRQTATTTGGTSSTLIRHYTDTSDNPGWTTSITGTTTTTTRYAESIGGDLGASIDATTGAAQLTLANPHGDVVTTVGIDPTQATTTACTSITAWSDYTEYGAPTDTTATNTVAGPVGYGWLGAKQRSTSTGTAGLTLMGDRVYNPATGRFTSTDPEPGGSSSAYAYPTDPVNLSDLDGHLWRQIGSWVWRHRGRLATIGATVGCMVPGVGWASCAVMQAAAWGLRSQQKAAENGGWRRNAGSIAADGILTAAGTGGGLLWRNFQFGGLGPRWLSPGRNLLARLRTSPPKGGMWNGLGHVRVGSRQISRAYALWLPTHPLNVLTGSRMLMGGETR
ncbi:RHS repeat-associated core domain-containing protein [Pedococcus sp. NPDC057267]|uniref:RHS repeat-associated core domain-containing protein n=1 Tax=Pedococcus sp. NPDC057267 TaxID=3346077 RepID=UPI00362A4789